MLFFFKQKTAYVMRISDGSSDGCSSDHLTQAVGRQLAVRLAAQDILQPGAQLGQRRAQVMGDGVRDIAHALDQLLDLFQHAVDDAGKLVEFVVGAAHRDALAEVAVDDGNRRAIDALDALQDEASDQQAADHREAERDDRGPGAAAQHHPLHRDAVLDVARSEEHTSELQSLMRISYAVFCLKKKKKLYSNKQ